MLQQRTRGVRWLLVRVPVRAWVPVVALCVVGCAGPVTRLEIEHRPDDAAVSGYVRDDCDYALWKVRSAGNEHQLARVSMNKGGVLGLDTAGGTLVAVGGTKRYTLEHGWYRWYRIVPGGEVAADVSLRIALFPFMLGAAMGGAP